jgi:hypothetical protein
MTHFRLETHADQLIELRMQRDEVHAERQAGQRLGAGDLGGELVRPHRAAGDHAEPARIRDCGNQMALAYPAHRAAHQRDLAA